MPALMRRYATPKIVGRADIDIAVVKFEKIDVPQRQRSPCAPAELRETPFALRSPGGLPPEARRAKGGGAGGIRTLDRALQPYNGLANRRLQPLGHSSVRADMPDAGASRKQRFDAIESVSQIGPSRPSNRGYVNLS